MAPTTVTCEYPGCPGPWQSPKGELDTIVKLLDMHFESKHSPPESKPATENSCTVKPEKPRRPEVSEDISDEDWQYFLYRWDCYKRSAGLKGEDIVLQLLQCCSETLRHDHHIKFRSNSRNVTESTLLAEIKNKAVNRTLKQSKGEPIREFARRICSY